MVEVNILLADRRSSAMNEIIERAQNLGLSVTRVLHRVGVITGRIPARNVQDLQAVPGVQSVSLDGKVVAAKR
jgi:hypothetical protein